MLNRRERVFRTRRNKLKLHRRRYELLVPGQRIQLDVKYAPQKVEGKQIYVYVAIDECTRWRYMRAYDSLCEGTTVAFLEELKSHCPFPITTIQTDHGREFTYKLNPIARHITHPMDRWCDTQNIKHQLIPPGVKELNGKVERSHRIDEQYFYWRATTDSLLIFNKQLNQWRNFYNHTRLHGGIQFNTPWEKLLERLETLQKPLDLIEEANLRVIRLKFIEQTPTSLTKQDRHIKELWRELEDLLKTRVA